MGLGERADMIKRVLHPTLRSRKLLQTSYFVFQSYFILNPKSQN